MDVSQRRMSERLAGKVAAKEATVQVSASSKTRTVKRKPLGAMNGNQPATQKESTRYHERKREEKKVEDGKGLKENGATVGQQEKRSKKRRFSFYEAEQEKEISESKSREVQLRKELEVMEAKYEKLKELKFADVESIYQKYKESVNERTSATDDLLERYKGEADRLRTLTQKSKEVNACKDLDIFRRENAILKGELLDLKAQLVEYELRALEMQEKSSGNGRDGKQVETGMDEAKKDPYHAKNSLPVSQGTFSCAPPATNIDQTGVIRILEILTGTVVKTTNEDTYESMIINPDKQRHVRSSRNQKEEIERKRDLGTKRLRYLLRAELFNEPGSYRSSSYYLFF